MAYDEGKDECLKQVGSFRVGKHHQVLVRVMRYNEGRAKLGLNRLVDTRNGLSTRQLGRIEKEEVPALVELLQEAYNNWPEEA